MSPRVKVLFLCTGNSCRSQMAEAFANYERGDLLEAHSAGTNPQELNPYAVKVMSELGIDISRNKTKSVDELGTNTFDVVVTVCEDAHENCPLWPGRGKVIHHGFQDPPRLAANLEEEGQIVAIYRQVRDEIREYIETLPHSFGVAS